MFNSICLIPAALLLGLGLLFASTQGMALSLKERREFNPDSKLPEASSHGPDQRRGEHKNSPKIDETSEKSDDCQHLAKPFSTFAASERRLSRLPVCRCDANHSGISAVEMVGSGTKSAARFCTECPGLEVKLERGHKWCENQKERSKTDFNDFCSQVPSHCQELVYYKCQCSLNSSEDGSDTVDTPTPVNNDVPNSSDSQPDSIATVIPVVAESSLVPAEAIDDFLESALDAGGAFYEFYLLSEPIRAAD